MSGRDELVADLRAQAREELGSDRDAIGTLLLALAAALAGDTASAERLGVMGLDILTGRDHADEEAGR